MKPPRFVGNSLQEAQPAPPWHGTNEYARVMTDDVVAAYSEAGLATEFTAILGRHTEDLYLVVDTAARNSKLTISCHKEKDVDGNTKKVWHREFVLSKDQLLHYQASFQRSWEKIMDTEIPDEVAQRLATDWIFFEQTADVAGNSCYMQHKFDRYVPDYNGQSVYFRSELTISRRFLESAGYDGSQLPLKAIESDHEDFRAGIALMLLNDSILRSGITDSAGRVQWLMKDLSDNYPKWRRDVVKPHSKTDVIQRLSTIELRNTRAELAEFVLGFDALPDIHE